MMRSRLRLALAAALAALMHPEPAHADLWGADLGPLVAILAETIVQGVTLGKQLTELANQAQSMKTMLSQLDPSSFSALSDLINNTALSYDRLVSDINSIGYTLDSVNNDFKTTFPTQFSAIPQSQFDAFYGRWQDQIWGSTLVAARAQSVLSTLHQNASNATTILSNSRSASGEVAQLQAVVQMLGVMTAQSNSLIQSLATTGRVLAVTASANSSERHLSREKKKRNLADYTKRGAPVPVQTKMP